MDTKRTGEVLHLLNLLVGAVLFAVAYRWFLVPSGLYGGGFTGLAQLLQLLLTESRSVKIPNNIDTTGIILCCMNIPLFVLGYKTIGRKFLYRTFFAVMIQSFLLVVIPTPETPVFNDTILNCIVGGALSGYGVGVTLRAGGSGGGVDIIGMYYSKKETNLSVGKINVLINICVYLATAVKCDLEVVAYSIIFTMMAGFITDHVHHQNIKVAVIIVSENNKLGGYINQVTARGVTSWSGWGEYSQSSKTVYMVVINKYELHGLRVLIRKEDPCAFVMIQKPENIIGNFDKRLEVL